MNSSCVKCQYLPQLVNTGSYGWLVESSVWKKKKTRFSNSASLGYLVAGEHCQFLLVT